MKLNRIKTVLVEKDLSQKWLAEQLGKSFSTINAYCCNRQQPNLDTLYKIAKLLSVELKDLIVDKTIEENVERGFRKYRTFHVFSPKDKA